MAQVDPEYLNCVVYIYKSERDARACEQFGGSGFLVAKPFRENPEHYAVYAVTNNHVINKCPQTVAIRLNTIDGNADVIATNPNDWMRHPSAADVRVIPIRPSGVHRYSMIPSAMFLSKEMMRDFNIGLGDDTFMVGRFVNHDGKQRNAPALRFGNIAMMPTEPIKDRYGIDQESFLVECRSIPGYSGSPVFVKLAKPPVLAEATGPYGYIEPSAYIQPSGIGPLGPWLLGIDWCHLPNEEPIFNVQGSGRVRREDMVAQSNTAMAGVVPAWLLADLLDEEELVRQRDEEDAAITARKRQSVVVEDFAEKPAATQVTPAGAEIPIPTKEQFLDDLTKASRKIKPE